MSGSICNNIIIPKSQIVFTELLTCVLLYFFVIDNTLKLNVATIIISNEQVKTELCCHMVEQFVTLVISFDLKRQVYNKLL